MPTRAHALRFALLFATGSALWGCGDAEAVSQNGPLTADGGGGSAATGGATAGGQGPGGMGGAGGSPTGGMGGAGGDAPKTFASQYPLSAEFPEGGIYDPNGHAFYVGSLADGSVHRIDANTGLDETMFVETAPGAWWTLGMAVDTTRDRLWACAMEDLGDTDADPAYDGYVWMFDLQTQTRQAVFDLSDAYPEATCTDVNVLGDGTAFVTDRDFGNVYRIDDQGVTLFAQDDELEGGFVGQNAVVVTPDESALLIAIYLTSRLVRVDLNTAKVTEVDIDGSFADATFLSGADGMTFHEGDVYVTFASELVKLEATLGDWSAASASEVRVPNGMTDVISTPNGLYLLNGQAIRYALGQQTDPFALVLFSGTFP